MLVARSTSIGRTRAGRRRMASRVGRGSLGMSADDFRDVNSSITRTSRWARPGRGTRSSSKSMRKARVFTSSSTRRFIPPSSRSELNYPTTVIHGSTASPCSSTVVVPRTAWRRMRESRRTDDPGPARRSPDSDGPAPQATPSVAVRQSRRSTSRPGGGKTSTPRMKSPWTAAPHCESSPSMRSPSGARARHRAASCTGRRWRSHRARRGCRAAPNQVELVLDDQVGGAEGSVSCRFVAGCLPRFGC